MNEIYILLQIVFMLLDGLACIILITFIIVNLFNVSADDWFQIHEILDSDKFRTLTLGIVILGYVISALKELSTCSKCSFLENAPHEVYIILVSMNMHQLLLISSLYSTEKILQYNNYSYV